MKKSNNLDLNNEKVTHYSAERYVISGRELEAVIKKYGLSQEEFGKAIGKSRMTVNRMISESGCIKLRYAQILEDIVGCDIYTMILEQFREKKKRIMELRIKNRGIQTEAERIKKERKLEAKLKKEIDSTQKVDNEL